MKATLRKMKWWTFKLQHVALAYLCDLEALFDYPPNANSRRHLLRAYLRSKHVQFEGPVWAGTQFRVFGAGRIALGPRCSIGNYSTITSHGDVEIGSDFLCSSHLVINSGTHDIKTGEPAGTSIRIGKNVWAGVRVTLVEDADVGDNCVIAAGSVLRGSYPANSLIAGVPAMVKKQIERQSLGAWGAFNS
jgi:acetyltransferase-like isoleucine patch superfamily enzyme